RPFKPGVGLRSQKVRVDLRNLLLLLLCTALSAVALEGALRVLWPAPTVYRALWPGLHVILHPQHSPGVAGPSVYQVNSMGVRGREFGPVRSKEYRILCIGGSTTEGPVNDQSRTWTSLLERHLDRWADGRRVWVGNAGRSGL